MGMNPIIDTDSYKASHFLQYPPGTTRMFSYIESRGGRWGNTVFSGLQLFIQKYLLEQPVTVNDVCEAREFFAGHGEPFPYEGWMKVVEAYGGQIPVQISSVDEGLVIPTHNALVTMESTDPELFWLVSWLETKLMRLWYPISVATQGWYIKRAILQYLEQTANDPKSEINFKLQDFGSRGVSSRETAEIGGMAHLVNFMGSDTCEGIMAANKYYGKKGQMLGYSIPASEHSTITSWGRENEAEAYRNMLKQFGGKDKLVACVSDSYDIYNAVENLWAGELIEDVKGAGGKLVIRPDSGNPTKIVLEILRILDRKVGTTINTKGYKVLPPYFGIIQGDGVNEDSINDILQNVTAAGFSASNVGFGMGGALLQKLDRDTLKFAMKCSWIERNGMGVDVYKDPVTDPGKKSKRGRQALITEDGQYKTIQVIGSDEYLGNLLKVRYRNGIMQNLTTMDEVRARAGSALGL